jgi:DNA replication protein DnaC
MFGVNYSLPSGILIVAHQPNLLVDELGYLSLDQQSSKLFYQVSSTRHSHKRSTLIATNTAFSDWGNILYKRPGLTPGCPVIHN